MVTELITLTNLKLTVRSFHPPPPLSNKDFRSRLRIDLFTDTAAILDNLDLRSIMECPGDMSKFCLLYTSAFWSIFLKFSKNKIVIGKKDRCAVLRCNNDRLFHEKFKVKAIFLILSVYNGS